MIITALLIWVGYTLSAPWWFYALLAVSCVVRMVKAGIDFGKAAK